MWKFLFSFVLCLSVHGSGPEVYFHELNTRVEKHYSDAIFKMGCESFEVMGHFNINRYAASANWEKRNDCSIAVLSGYFLSQEMGDSVHLLVLCHEIGHYLGGYPKKIEDNKERWSSAEGQADYYSTHTCFKDMLRFYPEIKNKLLKNAIIPVSVKNLCGALKVDVEVCELGVMAAFYKLRLENNLIVRPQDLWNVQSIDEALKNKSTFEVQNTLRGNFDYPSSQCQFDTYVAGILSKSRPGCWYKD